MISLTGRSPFLTAKPIEASVTVDRSEKVRTALDHLRHSSVQVLSSNPFRSFASQMPFMGFPQRPNLVYSLKPL